MFHLLRAGLWTATCLAAVEVVRRVTVFGIGLSPDSTVYIAAARRILADVAIAPTLLGTGQGIGVASIGPGYPVALAAASIVLRMDPMHAARWLNLALLPLVLLLSGMLIGRAAPGARWAPWLGMLALLVSWESIEPFAMAWTEGLFLVLLLLSFWCLDRAVLDGRRRWLAALAFTTALLCLVRFSGVAMVGTAMAGLVVWGRGAVWRRAVTAGGLGIVALAPMLAWSATAPGFRRLAVHVPDASWWMLGWRVVRSWIVPRSTPIVPPGRDVLAAVILVGLVLVLSGALVRQWRGRRQAVDSRIPEWLAMHLVIYGALLFLSRAFWDGGVALDSRMLLPVRVTSVLLVFIGVGRVPLSSGAWVRPMALTVAALWAFAVAADARTWFSRAMVEGLGYTSPRWRESAVLQAVRALPPDTFLVSNGNDAIVTLTGRASARLPDRVNPSTLVAERGYSAAMRSLENRLRQRRGIIVDLNALHAARWYIPAEADLRALWDLEEVFRGDDGALFRLRGSQP